MMAFGSLLLAAVCGADAPPYEAFGGRAMGTSYTVKIADRPTALSLAALAGEVRQELERIEQIFSLFRSDSELSRLNQAPAQQWIDVSSELYAVMVQALCLAERTAGAFDPTVGPLVRLWRIQEVAADWQPPSAVAIADARRFVGWTLVETRRHPPAIRKLATGVEIDLNALVEGWALDRLIDLLKAHGICNELVELGGEFRGIGRRDDGQAWQIGIEDPRQPGRLYATVTIADAALATSGDYRQSIEHRGRRYSHIIDPRTGAPIAHDLSAVSVLADKAAAADGWATALLVLGPAEGQRIAEQQRLAASFVSRGHDRPVKFSPLAAGRFSASRPERRSAWPGLTHGAAAFILGMVLCVGVMLRWRGRPS